MKMSLPTIARLVCYLGHGALTKPGFRAYNPNRVKVFYPNPNAVYDRILDEKPVFFSPSMASWIICGYSDVAQCIRDPRLTTDFNQWRFSESSTDDNEWNKVLDGLLFTLGKSDHTRIRRLTIPAFGPKTIDRIAASTEEIVSACLDPLSPGDTVNFAEQIARVIPRKVVADLVGVKPEDHARFEALTTAVMAMFDPSRNPDTREAQMGIDMMKEYLDERKQNPGDDFLSLLIAEAEEGDRINAWEAIGLVASLIAAGPDTSSDDLIFCIYNMLLNPAMRDAAMNHPERIDDIILEGTRWNHFGYSAPIRFALEDIEIGGETIRKGEMMRLIIPAAHRDPMVFQDPDRFDMDRPNLKQVLRFGAGAHFCVGSAIAQTVARMTVTEFLRRFPDFQLQAEPVYEKHLTSRRMREFWLTL
ncbi:Epothilone C/D epoxidase [BD1-7 clade bacterium]|uniref:Epothilone C/D epoxidase n=1 Tax=BD1-7 clade bacterium TaxID=2029982 RepID=A0A5S9QV20_9GAMM|nr:Epothilone C/D epoxidase [BD1-7 clade bacterium]